jgi:hypothetical protein
MHGRPLLGIRHRRLTVDPHNMDGTTPNDKTVTKRLHPPFTPYRSISARGISETDDEDLASINSLLPPRSSLDAMQEWLERVPGSSRNPGELLLRIIHDDIVVLIEVMRVSLEDIGRELINIPPTQLEVHALH